MNMEKNVFGSYMMFYDYIFKFDIFFSRKKYEV